MLSPAIIQQIQDLYKALSAANDGPERNLTARLKTVLDDAAAKRPTNLANAITLADLNWLQGKVNALEALGAV